jgi:hypothetical protein
MLLFGLRRIWASEVGFCHAPREEGRKTELRPDLGWHTAPPAVRRLFLANIADGSLAPAGFYAYVVGQNCLFCCSLVR